MSATQSPIRTVGSGPPARAVPAPGAIPGRRSPAGGALLVLATVAALIAGVWGFSSSLAAGPAPARTGEAVKVPGGLMRVDKVTPEHMAPMQMDKFAKKGMNMSGMVADMTPKGFRRFSVDVTLVGQESGGLAYAVDRFRITGEGTKETKPLRGQLEPGTVPQGSAVSGTMIFQVPEDAKELRMSLDGGAPIALDPGPGKAGNGGGPGEDHDGGH